LLLYPTFAPSFAPPISWKFSFAPPCYLFIIKKASTRLWRAYTDSVSGFMRPAGLMILSVKKESPLPPVEDITGYPSILGGRVKTLHPAVFGGILAKRSDEVHQQEMQQHALPFIDLVVVDLYPFEETVKSGGSPEAIIEKIDIGGISLIRAAAKNFNDVLIIPSLTDYPLLKEIIDNQNGKTSLDQRRLQALKAFGVSSQYDGAINTWFNQGDLNKSTVQFPADWSSRSLRYGENPHQKAMFHGKPEEVFTQLHGKELSYNNLLDVDAAISLISDFSEPTVAVIKHNNACGLASAPLLLTAWEKALAGDPVSAFGGIIITNREIDKEVAEAMNSLFFEVLLAPSFTEDALAVLQTKKNRMLLKTNTFSPPKQVFRSVLNGILEQEADHQTETEKDLKTVTQQSPSPSEISDLLFANKIVKHSKSNAIVLAKKRTTAGQRCGTNLQSGCAPTSHCQGPTFRFFPLRSSDGFRCVLPFSGLCRDCPCSRYYRRDTAGRISA
jgi:phosphoribosylaminoimidazolecarboxamide formyltransferase/IMP cyclohydrolase